MTVGSALLAPPPGSAQQAPTLLSAEATLAEYGIDGWASVRRGRVSVAHTPEGLRLGVYFLRDTPPARPSGVGEARAVGDAADVEASPPSSGAPSPAEMGPTADARRTQGLWVWNTRELLTDSVAREAFLSFVRDRGFGRVFLQVVPAAGERPQAGFVPFDIGVTAALVGQLSSIGVQVDALDGDPDYALPENHAGVLATVARVVEANRALPPQERFHGVHYDVEPYLVRGYQGPRRQGILDGYVTLVSEVSRAARAGGLTAGFDVPFWLDAPDEETGEVPMAVLDRSRQPVLDHVMSAADEVAVMDYRTFAGGPDGSVSHVLGEIKAADAGRARVFVAVEAGPVVDEDLYTFTGSPRDGFPEGPGGAWIVQEPLQEGRVRVWIAGNEPGRKQLQARLAGHDDLRYWPAGHPVRVLGAKQSFHDLGPARMQAETDSLATMLAAYPAFAGLAFHDYVSLKKLLEGG